MLLSCESSVALALIHGAGEGEGELRMLLANCGYDEDAAVPGGCA